jgi:prepilin-type N-terminal cleavage/methylation domain-containing protein
MRPHPDKQAGLTLVEMMVVLIIIAILAAVAVPSFSRDSVQADHERLARQLLQDIQMARHEAIAARDNRALLFSGKRYWQLVAVAPGSTVFARLREQTVAGEVEIAGFLLGAHTGSPNIPVECSSVELRFSALGDVAACGDALPCSTSPPEPNALTIFLQSTDGRHRSRIAVYQSTGHPRLLQGW